jgi:NCS1 family nucleobase:cation symporter-1
MQGPLALATGGVDLSWLTGMLAAGASYLVLHPLCGRPVASTDRVAAIDAFSGDVESSSP